MNEEEIYCQGLPRTSIIHIGNLMRLVGGEKNEKVIFIPLQEFYNTIEKEAGIRREIISGMMFRDPHALLEICKKVWDEDIHTWELKYTRRKEEEFYTSFKGKEVVIPVGFNKKCRGRVVKEVIKINKEDNCGNTEYHIQLDETCYDERGKLVGNRGDIIKTHLYGFYVKDNDEWKNPYDKKEYLVVSIPAEAGICKTDKRCCPADEIIYVEEDENERRR